VLFGVGAPGAAFDAGDVDRAESADVVSDPDGAVALNVTTALQEGTSGQCLVRVTNDLGTDVTVTVSLRDDSTDLGDLQHSNDLLGPESGEAVEFSLAAGSTSTVEMNTNGSTAGNVTYFHVEVSASGLSGTLRNRSAPIQQSAGTTCE
jgi:hypothetical protein